MSEESHWIVEVIEKESNKVIKRIDCGRSFNKATKVEAGINAQMDLNKYYTSLVAQVVHP